MGYYSYSKINTFKQCKYKYKLQYIDKLKVEIKTTIEAFMGNIVHKSLEKLYKETLNNKISSLKELLQYYENEWDNNFTDDILIVKKENSKDYYKELGKKFLIDYYQKYNPFNEMNIIGLETKNFVKLKDGNFWHVRIDKLGEVDNKYFICDYKTNNTSKTKEEAEEDEQLLMYSLFVKEKFKSAKEIILKWHMLAFNEEIAIKVDENKLEKLHLNTINTIKEIENTNEFDYNKSALCKYCIFQNNCELFKKEFIITNTNSDKENNDEKNVTKKKYGFDENINSYQNITIKKNYKYNKTKNSDLNQFF
jgi:hypothetical protein